MNQEKKTLPIPITDEQWQSIDHAVIARSKKTVAISQSYQKPIDYPTFKADFQTVKVIKEPNLPHQIQQHIRFTDKITGETYDVDSYLDTKEIRKYLKLEEDMKLHNIPYRAHSETSLKLSRLETIKIGNKPRKYKPVTITYQYKNKPIRTATLRLEPQ